MTTFDELLRWLVRDELQGVEGSSRSAEAPHHQPALVARRSSLVAPTKPLAMIGEKALIDRLDMAVRSLRNWRSDERVPRSMEIGRLVRYRRECVAAWIRSLV